MKRALLLIALLATISSACTQKEQTTTTEQGSSASTAPSEQIATSAPAASGKLYASFQFSDVAVTTSGAPVLRLGFSIKNGSPDPLLCEEANFTLQLADGSVINPDAGAENRCDPDTIDPGSTGKGTMFFDLKNGYSGPITLIMRDSDNAVIGQGTTQVH